MVVRELETNLRCVAKILTNFVHWAIHVIFMYSIIYRVYAMYENISDSDTAE